MRVAIVTASSGLIGGESKLKINEMGSRHLFIELYCLIEKWLSRKDCHRTKIHPKLNDAGPKS